MTDADGTTPEPGRRRRRSEQPPSSGAAPEPMAPVGARVPSDPPGTIAGGLVMVEPDPRTRRRRPMVWVLGAVIAVLAIALGSVGFAILQKPRANAEGATGTPTPSPTATFPQDEPAAAAGPAPCTPLTVLSSLENAAMVERLVAGYNAQPRAAAGHCVTAVATKDKSGVAATRAAAGFADLPAVSRPAVWIPDASSWLSAARADGAAAVPSTGTSLGQSAIVLAMPKPLADAIGWTKKAPTWSEVFAASAKKDVWSKLGHPEWGAFKLGKTSPQVASSGEAALLASFGAASGSVGGVTASEMADPKILAAVKKNELATSHYMATPEHFLWHARQAEQTGSAAEFFSAVIVDEKAVWDYDRGIVSRDGVTVTQGDPPKEAMVPVYPKDGFYVADNPAVVLKGDWVDDAIKAAGADFIRYAGTAQGQQLVRETGYRDLNGQLDGGVRTTGHLAETLQGALTFPRQNVIAAIDKTFPQVRKRASVLFLIDVSGSMADPTPSGQSKLDAAKAALIQALDHFTPGDQVGVAAFSSAGDGTITPGIVAPVADIATNRTSLVAAVRALTPQAYTPLYTAVDTYAKQMAASYDPDRITTVVLLSDGADLTAVPTTPKQTMLDDVSELHHSTPVLIFTLAYGADADADTLRAISSASGAHFYDATDPSKVGAVLGDLVTSF
ncbi:VWA domain-containing protein [Microbacterium sp. 8M]|uniref:vWA domain-containing protein n=1 Tax=Microbacterium sp. 8M TaxID=2653153 RepID=UPI0012F3B89F|nr:VWA domain-containing protein [Microbacterium sp. 8M]VXA97547.1 VWA domain-containing protein [Microbacterium sp. 8M]